MINIDQTKENDFNKDITKIFDFLREAFEMNNYVINSNYVFTKLNNTTQTSCFLKENKMKKLKLTRNCIINCQLKINYFLKFESSIQNINEILENILSLISTFLVQENIILSTDWNLIMDKKVLKNCIKEILNSINNAGKSEILETSIDEAMDVLEYFKNEINSIDLKNSKPLANGSKTNLPKM
ncbi:hypothetical protein [Spiroplasma endosymbiont of Danaus chrysippus]|uniref:hypothetical protein n=1 Tax=Spiroplasma endosymbiont of Danaus chrysippus TaxID=2691041 RepID=UPI00157B7FF1|nr:hypothetical protein [Spiroplasma endosymbiont of Danaus chrysippus]